MNSFFRELLDYDTAAKTPIYLQIANAFVFQISQGRLRNGMKLPGSREMAQILNLNRMTLVAVYDELEAQGWIEKVPRKGTFVRNNLPVLKPRKIQSDAIAGQSEQPPSFNYQDIRISGDSDRPHPLPGLLYLNDGFPDPRISPMDHLHQVQRSLSKRPGNHRYLMYGSAQGVPQLRDALSENLADTRGLRCHADNILVTRGAQMGIFLAASLILTPGDGVIVGVPGYHGANRTLTQLGAKIHHVPVDQDGLDLKKVQSICEKKVIRLIYIIPHHHNPTTVTLSPERRIRLLEMAQKYRFAILEDDYDYDFHYASRPMLPVASLDNQGNVIYIGTLTKTLAPSIRIGFMVAPTPFIHQATALRKMIDSQGDSLLELAIAEMYRDGSIARHIKKSLKLYRERRDHFCMLLNKELNSLLEYRIPDGGMSVWTKFISKPVSEIKSKALSRGLVMSDGTEYNTEKINYNSIRMGFASLNFNEQEKTVRILREIITGK